MAITRAINDLYFVDAPFTSVSVPGYDPNAERLTLISSSATGFEHLEIHISALHPNEPSEMYHDEIQNEEIEEVSYPYNHHKTVTPEVYGGRTCQDSF